MSAEAPPSEAACAGCLAALPGIGPATLRRLLQGTTASDAWATVLAGRADQAAAGRGRPAPPWSAVARRTDPGAELARWAAAGIAVVRPGEAGYPARLAGDAEAPAVLFARGDPGRLAGRCVAVVGTRRATADGRACATHLGRDLAAAGVCVVSGLALGIDGAAHAGALALPAPGPGAPGGTAGVAASGLDVPYPPEHRELWARVARDGVLLSETAPGQPAQRWRFPSRNRIVAALADAVVVVESHAAGGSLHTVEAALARGIDILVVPGPVASPASAGTNALLRDGATPVRDAADVLDSLGLVGAGAPSAGRRRRLPPATASAPQAADRPVLDAVGHHPTSLGRVVERCGLPLGPVAAALGRLAEAGLVVEAGGWWERSPRGAVGPPRGRRG